MKKLSKSFLGIILIAAILVSSFATAAYADSSLVLYGREALSKMSNGASLVYAYDQLVKGAETSDVPQMVSVRDSSKVITKDELQTLIYAIFSDHPELFWINKEWSYALEKDTQNVNSVQLKYYIQGSELATAKTKFDSAVAQMIKGLDGKSEYEKAKILHDRIAVNVDYVMEGHHQTAYGALVGKKAVCAGYATAYHLLLNKVGINAWTISGDSYNPHSSQLVRHEWNLVKLDGKHYLTDVTWDDNGDTVASTYYSYFNATTEQFKTTHIAFDFFAKNLPVCTATEANYFVKNNSVYNSFDAQKLADQLKKNGYSARIYVNGDADKFLADVQNNIAKLASLSGAKLDTYKFRSSGNEIIITFECKCSHNKTAKAFDGEYHWDACSQCGSYLNTDIHSYTGNATKCDGCDYDYASSTPDTPDTPIVPDENAYNVSIKNNTTGAKTINVGDILVLTALYTKPANATVCWYVDGEEAGTGDKFEFEGTTGETFEITVKLVDASDNIIKDSKGNDLSDTEDVTVKAGFFQKIISFFKNLFGMERRIAQ